MRIPDPKANTTTEAYLAYKAGYLEESELKPVLYEPYLHFDAWLAYWAGLTSDYPKNYGKNLCQELSGFNSISSNGATDIVKSGNSVSFTTSANGRGIFMTSTNGNNYTYCPELYSTGYVCSVEISATKASQLQIGPEGNGKIIDVDTTPKRYAFICYGNVGERIAVIFYRRNTAGECSYTISNIQVEKGSEATDFEEYSTTPEMLTDEEALVAYLSGVTDTYPEEIKDPYDVRIVGYLRHLASIRWPEPDYPVNNEEFYLSTMEPTHASNPEPSADIELDTVDGNIISVKAYGDTFQQTYSGKNLVNANGTFTYGNTNYRTTSNGDGTITTTSKIGMLRSAGQKIEGLLPNTVYTLSATLISYDGSLTSGYGGQMEIVDSSSGSALRLAVVEFGTISRLPESGKLTFTTPADVSAIWVSFNGRTTAPSSSAPYPTLVMGELQLEKGSTATSYEPYVGGVPAPSPDYPQDVNVVTGEQTVTVTGKNLLVVPNGSRTDNGITWTRNGNTFVGNGTRVGSSNWSAMTEFIDFRTPLPAGTYTLSIKSPVQKAIEFVIRDSSNVNVTSQIISIGRTSVTFTTKREASNFRVVSLDMTRGETLTDYTVSELQLEAGLVATSFELPQLHTLNLGSTELCKLGDYQDYIYQDADGDWYLHKAIGKITYTGDSSENWQYSDTSGGLFRIAIPNSKYYTSNNVAPLVYCDYYTPAIWNSITSYNYAVTAFNNNVLPFRNKDITSLDAWKAWLGSHNMTVYYPFATPTDTKITEATLVGQLDALANADTYNEKTYISVIANYPILPALLKVEAYKY